MPRGGARPGAGRKPDPNSVRAKARAAREAKAVAPAGFTKPDGSQAAVAPQGWPFGTKPPAPAPAPAPEPAMQPAALVDETLDPMAVFRELYQDRNLDPKIRLEAAKAAAPFEHPRLAPVGKKSDKSAAPAMPSPFAPKAPPQPKLAAVNGSKV